MVSQSHSLGSSQFVTLGVGREVFAIEVSAVREILDFRDITPLPHAPSFLLGLIDVRGATVAVVDLRARLGLEPAAATDQTRILVLEVSMNGTPRLLGLVADKVYEVAELEDRAVEPPPDIGIRWRSEYIRGVGRRNDTFVVIFNMDHLLSTDEMIMLPVSENAA